MSKTPQEVFDVLRGLIAQGAGKAMERDSDPYLSVDAASAAECAFDEQADAVMLLLRGLQD